MVIVPVEARMDTFEYKTLRESSFIGVKVSLSEHATEEMLLVC